MGTSKQDARNTPKKIDKSALKPVDEKIRKDDLDIEKHYHPRGSDPRHFSNKESEVGESEETGKSADL